MPTKLQTGFHCSATTGQEYRCYWYTNRSFNTGRLPASPLFQARTIVFQLWYKPIDVSYLRMISAVDVVFKRMGLQSASQSLSRCFCSRQDSLKYHLPAPHCDPQGICKIPLSHWEMKSLQYYSSSLCHTYLKIQFMIHEPLDWFFWLKLYFLGSHLGLFIIVARHTFSEVDILFWFSIFLTVIYVSRCKQKSVPVILHDHSIGLDAGASKSDSKDKTIPYI